MPRIRVKVKETGQFGTIPEESFDPNVFDKEESKVPTPDRVRVMVNETGKYGSIPANKFDPNIFTRAEKTNEMRVDPENVVTRAPDFPLKTSLSIDMYKNPTSYGIAYAGGRFVSGMANIPKLIPQGVRMAAGLLGLETVENYAKVAEDTFTGIQALLRSIAPDMKEQPGYADNILRGVGGAWESAGSFAAPGAASKNLAALGKKGLGAVVLLGSMISQKIGDSYGQMRDNGHTISNAAGISLIKGISTGAWESLSSRMFLNSNAGKTLLRSVGEYVAAETGTEIGEMFTDRFVDFINAAGLHDVPVSEAWKKFTDRLPEDLIETVVASVASGVGKAGYAKVLEKGFPSPKGTETKEKSVAEEIDSDYKELSPEQQGQIEEMFSPYPKKYVEESKNALKRDEIVKYIKEPAEEADLSNMDNDTTAEFVDTVEKPLSSVPENPQLKRLVQEVDSISNELDIDANIAHDPDGPTRQRGFVTSSIDKGRVGAVSAEIIGADSNSEYVQQNFNAWEDKAMENINRHGVQGIEKYLQNKTDFTPVDAVSASLLINHFEGKGQYYKAAALTLKTAEMGTQLGQSVAALRHRDVDDIAFNLRQAQQSKLSNTVEGAEGILTTDEIKLISKKTKEYKVLKNRNTENKKGQSTRKVVKKAVDLVLKKGSIVGKAELKSGEKLLAQVVNVKNYLKVREHQGTKSLYEITKDKRITQFIKSLDTKARNETVSPIVSKFVDKIVQLRRQEIGAPKIQDKLSPRQKLRKDLDILQDTVEHADKFPVFWKQVEQEASKMKLSETQRQELDKFFNGTTPKPFSQKTVDNFTKNLVREIAGNIFSTLYQNPLAGTNIKVAINRVLQNVDIPNDKVKKRIVDEVMKSLDSLITSTTERASKNLLKRKNINSLTIMDLAKAYHFGFMEDAGAYEKVKKAWNLPDYTPELKQTMDQAFGSKVPESIFARAKMDLAEIISVVGKEVSIARRLRGIRALNLLTVPKTMITNIVGTFANFAKVNALDIITGRTPISKLGESVKVQIEGLKKPFNFYKEARKFYESEGYKNPSKEARKAMESYLKLNMAEKYSCMDIKQIAAMSFGPEWLRSMFRGLTLTLGAPDMAFYTANYNRAIRGIIAEEGRSVPTPQDHNRADAEARAAIFSNDTYVGRVLESTRKLLNKVSTGNQTEQFGLGDAFLPFTRVEGSIKDQMLEMLPTGIITHYAPAKLKSSKQAKVLAKKMSLSKKNWVASVGKDMLDRISEGALHPSDVKRILYTNMMGGMFTAFGFLGGALGWGLIAPDDRKEEKAATAFKDIYGRSETSWNISHMMRTIQGLFDPDLAGKELQKGDMLLNFDKLDVGSRSVDLGIYLWDGIQKSMQRETKQKAGLKLAPEQSMLMNVLKAYNRTTQLSSFSFGLNDLFYKMGRIKEGGGGEALTLVATSYLDLMMSTVSPRVLQQLSQAADDRPKISEGSSLAKRIVQKAKINAGAFVETMGIPASRNLEGNIPKKSSTFVRALNALQPLKFMEDRGNPTARKVYDIYRKTGIVLGKRRMSTYKNLVLGNKRTNLDAQQLKDYQIITGEWWKNVADSFLQTLITEMDNADTDVQRTKLADTYGEKINLIESKIHKAALYHVTKIEPTVKEFLKDKLFYKIYSAMNTEGTE